MVVRQTVGVPASIIGHTIRQPLSRLLLPNSRKASTPIYTTVRHATHGTAGRANGPKNGAGRRLGAKKTGDQYVIPGNIIFRQRGAEWQPGENVGMGRDHTIYALEAGYVRYYRDPKKHTKRKYIGVVFDKSHVLPAPSHAARKRQHNMISVPRRDMDLESLPSTLELDIEGAQAPSVRKQQSPSIVPSRPTREKLISRGDGRIPRSELTMRPNYSFRESNWQIGRTAERAGVPVPVFKPNDRFAAWRKRTVKRKVAMERATISRKKSSGRKGRGRRGK